MRDIRPLCATGDPVPAHTMIGRRADVESISHALANGTNVVLAGAPDGQDERGPSGV
jgi:hypothetical protein